MDCNVLFNRCQGCGLASHDLNLNQTSHNFENLRARSQSLVFLFYTSSFCCSSNSQSDFVLPLNHYLWPDNKCSYPFQLKTCHWKLMTFLKYLAQHWPREVSDTPPCRRNGNTWIAMWKLQKCFQSSGKWIQFEIPVLSILWLVCRV